MADSTVIFDPSPPTDPETIWSQALQSLRGQMTQGSYEANLLPARLHSVEGQVWTIAAPELVKERLQYRFTEQIQRTLASLTGYELEIHFVTAARPEVARPASGKDSAGPALEPADLIGASGPDRSDFVRSIDFLKLWWGRSEDGGTGYDRLAKYWSRFWRAYLNRFNSRAYTLWEYLLHPDKSDQAKPPYWTRPRSYQIKPLAKVLGCAPVMITGGFRQCSIFDKALAEGTVLQKCCGAHCPSELRKNQYGQPQCRFWRTGALEVLYREGLLAIRVSGESSKNTFHHLQVWRLLPVLSPWQAQRLPESEWRAHEDWIEAQGKLISPEGWHTYTGRRMVFELARRDEGLAYPDPYQPNPLKGSGNDLLDSVESDEDDLQDLSDSVESDSDDPEELSDSVESNRPYQPILLDSVESDPDDE